MAQAQKKPRAGALSKARSQPDSSQITSNATFNLRRRRRRDSPTYDVADSARRHVRHTQTRRLPSRTASSRRDPCRNTQQSSNATTSDSSSHPRQRVQTPTSPSSSERKKSVTNYTTATQQVLKPTLKNPKS